MDVLTNFLATLCLLCMTCCAPVQAATNTTAVLSLNTATTNVTTGAFVVLSASLPFAPSQIIVTNATTSVLKFSYGPSGSEVDFVGVGGSATIVIEQLSKHLVTGTRFAVEAISGTASSGYILVSLIP
jgi:hypothetical protein